MDIRNEQFKIQEREERIMEMKPSTMSPGPRTNYWLAKQKAIAETQENLSRSFPGGYPQTPYPSGCYQPPFPGYYYPRPHSTNESTNPIDGNDPSNINFVCNKDNNPDN
ncbi:hypothetical protein ACLB2K_074571 [Fragaria x ananassa]